MTGRAHLLMVLLTLVAACGTTPPNGAPPATSAPAFDRGGASCSNRPEAHREFDRALLPGAVDAVLLDRAVRLYTNAERCAAGVAPLAASPPLAEAAGAHAQEMAAGGYVAHVRPGETIRTLADRLRRAEAPPYRERGENLMRITLVTPGVARIYRDRACSPPPEGPPPALGPTYRTVARRLVDAWLRTEALSVNVLEPGWTDFGAAIAIRPTGEGCGDVYGVETFIAR